MFSYTVEYEDYNGNSRKEILYFNLSAAELLRLQNTTPGGYASYIQKVIDSNDNGEIWTTFEDMIRMSYGVKSDDGQHFTKVRDGHKIANDFIDTPAYDTFMLALISNSDLAAAFVNGILPQEKLQKMAEEANLPEDTETKA